MTVAAFVAPYLLEATARFVTAAARLPGVRLGLVTQAPAETLPPAVAAGLAGHWRVDDALDPAQIGAAVAGLRRQLGHIERLVAALEQLQVPVARVREALGIPGMDVATARNFRDKSRMKDVLRAAGVPCARHCLAARAEDVLGFAREVGFPLVVKPPAGAGARATFRLDDAGALDGWLATTAPSSREPVLVEEFLTGDEHSFDSVTVGGRSVWHSVSHYLPAPLQVLRNPWMQWAVLLPRDIGGEEYAGIRAAGPAALAALGLDTALTHLEWFRRPDGSVAVSEVAARPPGAQITTLLSYAHDVDMYGAWADLAVNDRFDPPERRWAVGAAYLRGQGSGRVAGLHGVERLQAEVGHLVVEARLPAPGQQPAAGYEGDGYVIIRDANTAVVVEALKRLVTGLRVELA